MAGESTKFQTLANPTFAELYVAHIRMEAAVTHFARIFLQADQVGLKGLACVAERATEHSMKRCILLEEKIKALL